MSENNENENPEIIESNTLEAVTVEKTELSDEVAPVEVKKGGLLSFLAFLLAVLALASSAYLYLKLEKKGEVVVDDKEWQSAINGVESYNEQRFTQFANQIKKMQKTNSELQKQVNSIQSATANIQPSDNNGLTEKYDDSELVQQIQALKAQLENQVNVVDQMKKTASVNNKKQIQAVDQLVQKLNNAPPESDRLTLIDNNYKYEMAEQYLQAAHKQLSFYGNVIKGQEFLKQTIQQFSILEGEGYKNLALEIRNVSDDLMQNPPINISKVKNQINQLDNLSSQLSFDLSIKENESEESTSWYDKLVVIRKVDDEKSVKLTNAEQEKVYQDLANHYSAMKVALVSNNQILWSEEISSLDAMLERYFPTQSEVIKEELKKLKALDINPKMPDLSKYIESLKALNENEFNEKETPVNATIESQ
jgi:uncharacterized protein HemX